MQEKTLCVFMALESPPDARPSALGVVSFLDGEYGAEVRDSCERCGRLLRSDGRARCVVAGNVDRCLLGVPGTFGGVVTAL